MGYVQNFGSYTLILNMGSHNKYNEAGTDLGGKGAQVPQHLDEGEMNWSSS